jgi:hypothetical protein
MDAQDVLKMQKTTLTVTSLLAPSDDPVYWHAKSPWERLQAVETLRRLHYGHGQSTARLQRVLAVLSAHHVEYLLIGGYAVAYHGYQRATADMAIWIAPHPQNAEKVVAALKALGFDLPELSPALFLQEGQIIRMGVPALRTEIATSISRGRFEECYAARVIDILDEVEVHLIGLTHLKANKKAAGSYKDLNDLENLP